jgi:CHAT domain-containing protein
LTTPYRPAIVQLGLSELPGDQIQIKAILLLAKGEPLSFSQTLPAERVKGSIRQFQRQLSRKEAIDPARGPGMELSRWLLAPLEEALRANGVNALLIAADRGLQAIPYGALPFGDQPLAQRYALSVSPSLGLLDLEANRASFDGQLLAAGASRFQQALAPLPMVPRELAALATERAATLLLDEQFTVEALRRLALQERFGRLHIATHAAFLPGRDDAAQLYTPRESMSLKALRNSLRARSPNRPMDLITLSACLTALGDEQSELGFVGMALQAGARSAVGSLWDVDDAATAAFFIQFYRYLYSGLDKDQALQATARAFLNGLVRLEGHQLVGPAVSTTGDAMLVRVDSAETQRRLSEGLRHPHYWAGMVLTGSPW